MHSGVVVLDSCQQQEGPISNASWVFCVEFACSLHAHIIDLLCYFFKATP